MTNRCRELTRASRSALLALLVAAPLTPAIAADPANDQTQESAQPAQPTQSAQPAQAAQQPAQSAQTAPLQPPEGTQRQERQVAQIFEQPGILTQPGKYALEPSLQYAYASTNRVALVGYTIIPALTIGLIDVREVKRNTWTAALTGRFGLTRRMELEVKVPWVYRSDDSISRPLATPEQNDVVFNTDGRGLGDIEFTGRYQLNDGGLDEPYYVASLRFKTRTGRDPFEVLTNTSIPGFAGLGLQQELPTGSGFYTLQPGITFLLPSDPVVFFGSLNYQYNFERNNVELRQVDSNGQITSSTLGSIQAGGVLGFNFGMGLSLNDKASFSIGYDHAAVRRTRINGSADPLSVPVQLGTLLLGYAYRLTPTRNLNVSLGVGATRDAPDVQLTVRVPTSF